MEVDQQGNGFKPLSPPDTLAAKDGSRFGLSATPVTMLAHALALLIAFLMLYWNIHFRGGLGLNSENKQQIFNMHPVLMMGFVLVGGEAIMAFKTVPSIRKIPKAVHLILHLIGLSAGSVGIYAAFKFHNQLNIPNMYSLHSWIGIATIFLYGLQWLVGLLVFFFPGAAMPTRASFLPWHWLAGMAFFLMAVCSVETGLQEKFTFLQLQYQKEASIVNLTGLVILLFAFTVTLTVALSKSN